MRAWPTHTSLNSTTTICCRAQATEVVEIDPNYLGLQYSLGLVYERLGRFDEATAAFERVSPAGIRRGSTIAAAAGLVRARAGARDEALHTLERLESLAVGEYVSSYDLALLSLAVGNADKAIAFLSKAIDEHASFVPYLNIDARLDPLRSDARFTAIVDRVKFPRV